MFFYESRFLSQPDVGGGVGRIVPFLFLEEGLSEPDWVFELLVTIGALQIVPEQLRDQIRVTISTLQFIWGT